MLLERHVAERQIAIVAPSAAAIALALAGSHIAIGVALTALPFALLPLAAVTGIDGFTALGTAEFLSSWAIVLFDTNNNALRTVVTQDQIRARVSGAYSAFNYGIRPLGALLGGWIATITGAGHTITAAALLGTLALLWILTSPIARLQQLDDA